MSKQQSAYQAALSRLRPQLIDQAKRSLLELSFSLYDFATGEWIEFEPEKPVYPASLIKMLFLLTALKQIEKEALFLDDSYLITGEDKYAGGVQVEGSGILKYAKNGSIYSVEELLFLMVSISDNVASNIIFDLVGADAIADLAASLSLTGTRASRKMYELNSPQPANVSTARDLTMILIALEKKELCREELAEKGIAMMIHTDNKRRIGRYLKGNQLVVANKIGTVSHMVGDMALIYFPKRPPVALTVLVQPPPDEETAAKEIGRLASAAVSSLDAG